MRLYVLLIVSERVGWPKKMSSTVDEVVNNSPETSSESKHSPPQHNNDTVDTVDTVLEGNGRNNNRNEGDNKRSDDERERAERERVQRYHTQHAALGELFNTSMCMCTYILCIHVCVSCCVSTMCVLSRLTQYSLPHLLIHSPSLPPSL